MEQSNNVRRGSKGHANYSSARSASGEYKEPSLVTESHGVRRPAIRTPYIFPASQQQSPFSLRPRMTHAELVALNLATLTTMARGEWTPRFPPKIWDGADTAAMRLHIEHTVDVDVSQLVATGGHRVQFVDQLADSYQVGFICRTNFEGYHCSDADMLRSTL